MDSKEKVIEEIITNIKSLQTVNNQSIIQQLDDIILKNIIYCIMSDRLLSKYIKDLYVIEMIYNFYRRKKITIDSFNSNNIITMENKNGLNIIKFKEEIVNDIELPYNLKKFFDCSYEQYEFLCINYQWHHMSILDNIPIQLYNDFFINKNNVPKYINTNYIDLYKQSFDNGFLIIPELIYLTVEFHTYTSINSKYKSNIQYDKFKKLLKNPETIIDNLLSVFGIDVDTNFNGNQKMELTNISGQLKLVNTIEIINFVDKIRSTSIVDTKKRTNEDEFQIKRLIIDSFYNRLNDREIKFVNIMNENNTYKKYSELIVAILKIVKNVLVYTYESTMNNIIVYAN